MLTLIGMHFTHCFFNGPFSIRLPLITQKFAQVFNMASTHTHTPVAHTSVKEVSINKLLCPQLLQPNSHHVDPIGIHCRTEGTQLACPHPTERSSKTAHEVEDGWLLRPKRLQGHLLYVAYEKAGEKKSSICQKYNFPQDIIGYLPNKF